MNTTNPAFTRKGILWSLEDEKNYLDHLGTGLWYRNIQKTRTQLLRSYVDTIHFRSDPWVPKALEYAKRLLIYEEEERG